MSTEPQPHYLTTPKGQMRYWRIGSGPALLVLPGLVLAASIRAGQVAAACPGWTVICPELPGIGGSVGMGAAGTDAVVACLAEAATALGLAATALVSFDRRTARRRAGGAAGGHLPVPGFH